MSQIVEVWQILCYFNGGHPQEELRNSYEFRCDRDFSQRELYVEESSSKNSTTARQRDSVKPIA
jgi:hypothetical protein